MERKLSNEEKLEIGRLKVKEGSSSRELALRFSVCTRTVIRISNKYKQKGELMFEKSLKPPQAVVCANETDAQKITRLEQENTILRMFQDEMYKSLKKK